MLCNRKTFSSVSQHKIWVLVYVILFPCTYWLCTVKWSTRYRHFTGDIYASTSAAAASLPYKNVPYKSVIQPDNTFWKSRFLTHISGRFPESIIPLDNALTKICNVRDNTFRQFEDFFWIHESDELQRSSKCNLFDIVFAYGRLINDWHCWTALRQ